VLPGSLSMRRNVTSWIFLLLPVAAVAGCNRGASGASQAQAESSDEAGAQAKRPVRVVVSSPTPAEGAQQLVLPGTIEAWETAPLYARVTGYLESVSADIGDQVESGAELARIVVPEMRAELSSAQSRVAQEQAELELARITKARLQSLREANPEAIPQQDVDVAAAKEQIEAAQVGVAQAEQERLRTLSAFGRLRAPFAGRITKRVLDPGALAREGTTSDALPIVEIARTDKLRLAFEVPEPMAPHVSVGTPVKLRFDAFPGRELEATVARLAGALDPSTRSMRAEIDLENEEGRYQPGMYASVRLAVEMNNGALAVPSRAVRGRGGDRYCLVARDGVLEKAPVVVASDDGRQAMIARGLDPEDRVMVAGSPLARAGTACEAVEEGSE